MARSVLPRRRRAAATALATVSLVLTATALPAAPAAAATALPPWSSTAYLASVKADVQDVVVTGDGTAVALWEEGTSGDLYASVRPAHSDTWGGRVQLGDTVREGRASRSGRTDRWSRCGPPSDRSPPRPWAPGRRPGRSPR